MALSWSVRRAGEFATFIHDEDAYVLQAQIFARGRLAAPPRPVPDAFEQYYVLGTPVTAGKYYPGQALAIAPFEAVGHRDLLPPLSAGVTAGLLVHLVQGLAGPLPAIAAWATWLAGDKVLTWHSTFLSQPTSAMLWLLAITGALRWHRTQRRRDLVGVAVALAADALTRPWSAVLLAVTLGAWLAVQLTRRRQWAQAVPALAAGCAIMAFVPLFNRAVTGHAATSPLSVYTTTTMPYDRLGFGHGEAPPRALPEDHRAFHAVMRDSFAEFVPRRAPDLAAKRALRVGQLLSAATWRLPLVLAAVLAGLVWGSAASRTLARQLAVPALALHLGYSAYAFATSWNGYDLEAAPLWAAIVGLGLGAIGTRLGPTRALAARWVAPAFALLAASDASTRAAQAMWYARVETSTGRAFRAALAPLAAAHAEGLVVYVRYADGHDVHRSVVVNAPFDDEHAVWVVHARPETNRAVLARAGARTPVLAQELPDKRWRLDVAPRPD
jgi:hypothetical protein